MCSPFKKLIYNDILSQNEKKSIIKNDIAKEDLRGKWVIERENERLLIAKLKF